MYELEAVKVINGYSDCTHFQVDGVIDEAMVVGTYGIIELEDFIGLYGSATCLKSDLIDYIES
jgi:hypothetical protein